jgi:hypothetical protein
MDNSDGQDVMDQDATNLPSDDETPMVDEASSGGAQQAGVFSRYWKLLVGLILTSGLLAVGAGLWFFGDKVESEPEAVDKLVGEYTPLLSASRVKQIHQRRTRMLVDTLIRSSRNVYLTTEIEEDALADINDSGDLIVVARIFNNYVEALAVFIELGRIITNNYLANQAEVRDVFEQELMPKFRYAERRRNQLRPRIKSQRFVPLLDNLDYIAFHDSIAVYSLQAYLRNGQEIDFTNALDFGYKAKLMKKDFWNKISYYMDKYDINFVRNEKLWHRYFGSWDEVEP